MARVTFLPAAAADYEDAHDWYRSWSESAAAGLEDAVEQAISQIVEAPDRWPFCDRRHRQHLLKTYPYSIVYRVEGEFRVRNRGGGRPRTAAFRLLDTTVSRGFQRIPATLWKPGERGLKKRDHLEAVTSPRPTRLS